MGCADDLRTRQRDALESFLAHPFFQAVQDGSLTPAARLAYFRYERAFVWRAVEIFALILTRVPDVDAARHLVRILDGLVHDQIALFDDIFRRLGAEPDAGPVPAQAAALGDGMVDLARRGYAEGLAAMYAAEWTYAEVSRRMAAHPPADPLMREWFALHTEAAFVDGVAWVRSQLDACSGPAGVRQRLEESFAAAIAFEMDFHDAPLRPNGGRTG